MATMGNWSRSAGGFAGCGAIAALSMILGSHAAGAQAAADCGKAAFRAASSHPVGASPGSIVAGDLNDDGKLDLVVASEEAANLSILIGAGAGRFTAAAGSPVAAGRKPNDIALGRFNADKELDIAVANHEASFLTVLVGDGRGRFRLADGSPIPVDVKPHPHGIATADFDGDGRLDLVIDGWETDEVKVLRGGGDGRFYAHATLRVGRHPYQRVRSWDVNGDGHADIVTANLRGASVTVLHGNGRGAFSEAPGSPFPANPFPTSVVAGDFNDDGHRDLAVTNSPSNSAGSGQDGLSVLLNNGRGELRRTANEPLATGRAPTQLVAADFDGDGRDDIAVSNMNSGTVTIACLATDENIRVVDTIAVGRLPKGIAAGDFDANGRPDLAVANNGDGNVTVILAR
jgi:hypothetical protein